MAFARHSRTTPYLLICLNLLLLTAPAGAEWPQWRGPDGLGVAADPGPLPETWEPGGPRIRWQTLVPGEGISSPIVSRGRVFLTTAYEGSRHDLVQGLLSGVSVVLCLVVLWLVVRSRSGAAIPGGGLEAPGSGPSRIDRWDRRVVLAASLGSLFLALALALEPDLFVVVGNPGRAWRATGAVALLALAAAIGWSRRASWWRLLGVALVVGASVLLVRFAPTGALGRASISKLLPFFVLGLGTALWYVVGHVLGLRTKGPAPPGWARAGWIAGTLALIALLAFVPHNFLAGLQRAIVCLDLESGEILWQRSVFSSPAEQKWENSSFATPTPVTDGESVFAYFGHGIASVDFDGRVRWRVRLPGYAESTRYGAGSSPILTADAVIVMREEEIHQEGPPSWIEAFDKSSGDRLWRLEPPGAHDSYTTPMVVPTAAGDELLTASWKVLVAYDAESGERRWSFEYPMEQMVASMARSGDLLAVTGGVYGEKTLMMLRLAGAGVEAGAELVWRTSRGVAGISSPVLYDGRLFTVTTSGIMSVYQAETGAVLWQKRLEGEYFASLVAGDGKVYALNTEGTTTVVAAGAEPVVIAENDLGERAFASPAIAGGCLLVRTSSRLHCIEAGPTTARLPYRPSGGDRTAH